MEYAIRLPVPGPLPEDPRQLCPSEWQDMLPAGPLRALYLGSEFCQDLLPGIDEVEEFCAQARKAGVEAVLLTPVVRAGGLFRIEELIAASEERRLGLTVVCNDFGVLHLLCNRYPRSRFLAGRLFNRALRDPRLADHEPAPNPVAASRGGKLRQLLLRSGAEGLETDPDLDGSYLGDGSDSLRRVLHLPYIFAATGRNCLSKAATQPDGQNFAAWLDAPCAAPCRGRCEQETRTDLNFPLWRAGNTLFYTATMTSVRAHLRLTDRIVVHPRPMP